MHAYINISTYLLVICYLRKSGKRLDKTRFQKKKLIV